MDIWNMTLFVSRYGIILLDVSRSPELKTNQQASHNHNYIGEFTYICIIIEYPCTVKLV
jgi:hypothetical protein